MQPRAQSPRKANRQKLDIRTALLVLLAQYVALADAALLYAAHQAVPLIAISVAVAFVAAYRWFDGLIELRHG